MFATSSWDHFTQETRFYNVVESLRERETIMYAAVSPTTTSSASTPSAQYSVAPCVRCARIIRGMKTNVKRAKKNHNVKKTAL